MRAKQPEKRMFRCFYHPTDRYGNPVPMASGDLPSIDVPAVDRDEAASKAHRAVKAPITDTQRLDDVPVPTTPRARRSPKPKLADLGLTTAAALLSKESK